MTPELSKILDDAYRIFAGYELHRSLIVCHCNVCMTTETERALIQTPLSDIPAKLLAEYTNSAHDWDDGPVATQMRYFLPRYLELIAENDPPCNMGLDICLRRFGSANWRQTWPDREVELLDRFFDALIADALSRLELVLWPVGWRLQFDLKDVLTMVITAHGDLSRVLNRWDREDDPPAAIHMAAMRSDVLTEANGPYLHSAYLERDHEHAARCIGEFLMRPAVDERLERAFFMLENPQLQQILSDAMQI